jgi:hypothetical protein
MKINDILILGSTKLTEYTVKLLQSHYNLIGYVPSRNPTVAGDVPLPELDINTDCDLKLSIQYDRMVKDTSNCFNVHTGLLPDYGGTNILGYTLKNKDVEQGLTFHKMTQDLDQGPIISRTSYPVLPTDSVSDLFDRVLLLGPRFTLNSLKLLETLEQDEIETCWSSPPIIYKRGEFETPVELKSYD